MKKILIISGVVVFAGIILLIAGISNIDLLIKKAVLTAGPEMTKTTVSLEDVSISIFSGEARIENFVL